MNLEVKNAHLIVTRNSGRRVLCGLIQLAAPPYTGVIPFDEKPSISDGQAFVVSVRETGVSIRPLPSTLLNEQWRLSGRPLSDVALPDSPWPQVAGMLQEDEFVCLVTAAVGVCGQWGSATQSWALVGAGIRCEDSAGGAYRMRDGKMRVAGHLPERLATRKVDDLMAEAIWLAGDGTRYALPYSSGHGMWLRARAVALQARWAGACLERKHILFAIKGDPSLGAFIGRIGETPNEEARAAWWLLRRGHLVGPAPGPASMILKNRRLAARARAAIARTQPSDAELLPKMPA